MAKPVIVQSKLIPKGICINILGALWTRDASWIDNYIVNHERIHTAQQKELLFITFYVVYVVEWLFRLVQYRNRNIAYMNISFEREAYTHGHNLDYLKNRKRYSWLKFI